MGTFAFTVDTVQAKVLGRALGVDVDMFPLSTVGMGYDLVHFAAAANVAAKDLEQRGLTRHGRLTPALRTTFGLFGGYRAAVAVSGIDGTGKDFSVLGLSDGSQAVTIFQYAGQDEWAIDMMTDDDWLPELVDLLPEQPAAPRGRPLTITTTVEPARSAFREKRDADAEDDQVETAAFDNLEVQTMVRPRRNPFHGRARDDSDVLTAILAQPRLGVGRILVSCRDRHGRTRQTPPFGWLDAEEGRFLVDTHSNDDQLITTYTPASRSGLAQRIRAAIRTVY